MKRTIAIGDIHGCYKSFNALLKLVLPKADTLVLLGDYVDRGPDSKKVIEIIINLKKSHARVIALQGNHDLMFLQYLEGQTKSPFIDVGGLETLSSYDIPQTSKHPSSLVPKDHLHFFHQLPLYFEDDHAIYVHAGLEPRKHLSLQRAEWCLWARENFLRSTHNFGKPVIFGHTSFDKPHISDISIGIDTGAVYGGTLTALILPDMEFISVPGEQEKPYQ